MLGVRHSVAGDSETAVGERYCCRFAKGSPRCAFGIFESKESL
jgi:hypothetical protein